MDPGTGSPLFIAQKTLCYYPISTIYNSCPRYLFYALILASCVTRWTGWLADVFLGAAATYAGTAAIQAFILLSAQQKPQSPSPITIPFISANTSLTSDFPELVTETDYIVLAPASLELDADAVLAIVVTGYLVFLPLQAWSRVLTHDRARNLLFYLWNILMLAGSICALIYAARVPNTPTQYMFCYPDIPPYDDTSSDGWQSSWRTSTWNSSVWETFSNISVWGQIGDICYNPCFNTTQILRQQTSLHSATVTEDSAAPSSHGFWNKILYSKRYIYSLIILCLVLNCLLLVFKFLPYKSRIPSSQIVVIWKSRRKIWNGFKEDVRHGIQRPLDEKPGNEEGRTVAYPAKKQSLWHRLRPFLTWQFVNAFLHVSVDAGILFGMLFSMIISPFTIVAFVAWAEWTLYNDGPSQESPQQVGQWAYLVSIALLVISAGILTLKYRIASSTELDNEIEATRMHLTNLEEKREARSESDEL
ncbi:hypothetical protein PENANT_c002G01895 [Penicillium antarcticum]|uniref:Uncharacterized protein n=1 Tax=Penicillium antarcticum TaxID=416450 RepID=A0A1V6QK01_9EURO|nr:uncharacterized protein N7508_006448 [Penicillium antarcticum]KAJ5301585.1 hypothetical protein N7508_006448 [Penicillium antarcticum]OQD89564.1 hypothetical protein PENANT_c002G01895 [Penicillium antarcticum]